MFVFVLLAFVVLIGCDTAVSPGEPEVNQNLAKLTTLIRVPKGVTATRWLVRRFSPGSRLVPGPGDFSPTMVLAYLETAPNFWRDEGFMLSPGNSVERAFALKEARAIFPASLQRRGSTSAESLRLNCVRLAPEAFAPIEKMGEALRCGDGIVVSFKSP